jgi:hypothetical protein
MVLYHATTTRTGHCLGIHQVVTCLRMTQRNKLYPHNTCVSQVFRARSHLAWESSDFLSDDLVAMQSEWVCPHDTIFFQSEWSDKKMPSLVCLEGSVSTLYLSASLRVRFPPGAEFIRKEIPLWPSGRRATFEANKAIRFLIGWCCVLELGEYRRFRFHSGKKLE